MTDPQPGHRFTHLVALPATVRVRRTDEGRDAAGKGGTIKAITERVSPRVSRVVALAKRRIPLARGSLFSHLPRVARGG